MSDATAILDSLESDMWQSLYRCRHDREHRESMIPVLAGLLRNSDSVIKQRAMRAVAKIGHCDTVGALAELVPLLCSGLQHEDELTRRTALGALHVVGRDNPDVAVPALVDACDDERLLDASLLALIEIGDAARSAAACFRRFASHRSGKIRRLVMRGLGGIRADDAESLAILNSGASDANRRVREMARRAISQTRGRQ